MGCAVLGLSRQEMLKGKRSEGNNWGGRGTPVDQRFTVAVMSLIQEHCSPVHKSPELISRTAITPKALVCVLWDSVRCCGEYTSLPWASTVPCCIIKCGNATPWHWSRGRLHSLGLLRTVQESTSKYSCRPFQKFRHFGRGFLMPVWITKN